MIKVKVSVEYELDITDWYTDENDKPLSAKKAVEKLNDEIDREIFENHLPSFADYKVKLIK